MLMLERELEGKIMPIMDQLLADIGSHFVALGLLEGDSGELVWKLAAGNLSDRYKTIAGRVGKGLAGSVIKVGRGMSLHVSELIANRQLHEYPILLAEKLRSAFAVPIMSGNKVQGVLLAGDRVKRIYRQEDKQTVTAMAERVAEILAVRS